MKSMGKKKTDLGSNSIVNLRYIWSLWLQCESTMVPWLDGMGTQFLKITPKTI